MVRIGVVRRAIGRNTAIRGPESLMYPVSWGVFLKTRQVWNLEMVRGFDLKLKCKTFAGDTDRSVMDRGNFTFISHGGYLLRFDIFIYVKLI